MQGNGSSAQYYCAIFDFHFMQYVMFISTIQISWAPFILTRYEVIFRLVSKMTAIYGFLHMYGILLTNTSKYELIELRKTK